MSDKYDWYLPGAETTARLEAASAEQAATQEARKAFQDEIGAEMTVRQGGAVAGFVFSDPPGKWRCMGSISGRDFYAPYRRSKADKELWSRIQGLHETAASGLNRDILGDSWGISCEPGPRGGFVLRGVSAQQVNGEWLLGLPRSKQAPTAPEDCTPIPLSEYYRRVEAEKDAA